jgi:hypothetical protein
MAFASPKEDSKENLKFENEIGDNVSGGEHEQLIPYTFWRLL